jgi:ribosomal protein S18 acetylase RimI-like enzyme
VTPEYRGTGTSKAFLSSVIESAAVHGYETVLLKVHEDNPVAKRLYESAGFVTNQKWQKRYEMMGRTQPFLQ